MKKLICLFLFLVFLFSILASTLVVAKPEKAKQIICVECTPESIRTGECKPGCREVEEAEENITEAEEVEENITVIIMPSKAVAARLTKKNITITTTEEIEIINETLYINSTKGRKQVKIMPDTTSAIAIERLKLLNFTIELKDTGKDHVKPTYVVDGEKEARLFGFIKIRQKIKSEISGETGEIERTRRPWWSFLATK